MGIVIAIIFIYYFAFRIGSEDGNWGCFTVLMIPVALAFLISLFQ